MLIWINGPFGGGKTAAAFELARRLPNAVVCDPEHVGFGLHRTMPRELRGDFQDLAAWRSGVVEVLDLVLTKQAGPVIVPMTLVDPAYFDEIVGGLRRRGHEVCHVALLAERDTIARRLRRRGLHGVRRDSFAIDRLDHCLARLQEPAFATHIRTDGRSVPELAEQVARECGLTLSARSTPIRALAQRVATSLRHVRIVLAR